MRISNIRSGRICRLVLCCLVIFPLLYLLTTWSEKYKRSQEVYQSQSKHYQKLESRLKEVPVLVEGLGNFEPKDMPKHSGPGENGKPHHLPAEKQAEADESEMQYGMNIACSDEISMHRRILDTRLEECKHWNYPYDLPTTSVIIVFHNEGFSVLMRTVHSVVDRTPPHILHEILLVDDYSDKQNLKNNLEEYIKKFNGLVRLIRNSEREGLIRTRSRGAKEATGEVIVYLDAHCEVNVNWLPPLLAPIYRDRTVMTVPIIDGIDHRTFRYHSVYGTENHFRGIFEWGMLYKENELPKRERRRRQYNTEPYRSPTHAGGLFAINREYFLELGAYDPGLLVWGGENFELSFKIWQCGGSIEWVPCSHVGHVYRGFMPYNFGKLAEKKKGSLITINYKRVIETWFDDIHKEYFYTREPLARYLDMGNISQQLNLKKRLNCKSFQWYMDNIAYDVYDKFPSLPANLHWGELRAVATDTCLDSMGNQPPALMGLSHCHGSGNHQLIRLNAAGQLGVGERCIEGDRQGIKLAVCRLGTVDGPWSYNEQSKHLLHRGQKKCMSLHPVTQQLFLAYCDTNDAYQEWKFKTIKLDYH
uniref:Polypeptide N-acetylgalactosaminyltransferase n=1 Tax=Glossina pallidipes TaxID=7398 RepID=A0A1A9ZP58_GLOPL